jgi:hypothetical protein
MAKYIISSMTGDRLYKLFNQGRIGLVPRQRGMNWTLMHKAQFLSDMIKNSIFGFCPPTITVRRVRHPTEPGFVYLLIDGQQKTSTLFSWLNTRRIGRSLSIDSPKIELPTDNLECRELTFVPILSPKDDGFLTKELQGKTFQEMPGYVQNYFENVFSFTMEEYDEDLKDEEEEAIFAAKNNSMGLTPGGKMNAKDFFRNNKLVKSLWDDPALYSHKDGGVVKSYRDRVAFNGTMITKVLAMVNKSDFEKEDPMAGTKGAEVRKVVEQLIKSGHFNTDVDVNNYSSVMKDIRFVFKDCMDLADRPFVISFALLFHLKEYAGYSNALDKLQKNVSTHWNKVTNNKEFKLLNRTDTPATANAMLQEIKRVFTGMMDVDLYDYLGLSKKDAKRTFSSSQKEEIREKSNNNCLFCNEPVGRYGEGDKAPHFHHVTPHQYGGLTSVDNGALCHQGCHEKHHSTELTQQSA